MPAAQILEGMIVNEINILHNLDYRTRMFGPRGLRGVPIAKTNCWATAGSTVTTSTKGASPDAGLVSRGNTSGLDVIPCR
jgi:hypothetical protein